MNRAIVLGVLLALPLAACDGSGGDGSTSDGSQATTSGTATSEPSVSADAPPAPEMSRTGSATEGTGTVAPEGTESPSLITDASEALPTADKGEKGARAVLLTWARALENKQFDTAWNQFGDPPASREDYARWWSRYRTITVAVPTGSMDAGAGSLYYSSHATLTGLTRTGEPYRLEGTVVLRRVNDVPGATPAQLRWHIESAVLHSAQR